MVKCGKFYILGRLIWGMDQKIEIQMDGGLNTKKEWPFSGRTPQTEGEWDLLKMSLPGIHVKENKDGEEIYRYYDDEEGRHFLDQNNVEYRLRKKNGEIV